MTSDGAAESMCRRSPFEADVPQVPCTGSLPCLHHSVGGPLTPRLHPLASSATIAGMSGRFQFSLKALLGLTAIVCLSLGGWHLLETYGTSIEAVNPRIGMPIRLKGSYFLPFGPDECTLSTGYSRTDDTGSIQKYLRAKRSWLCFYSVEYELDPVDHACQIEIYLTRYESSTDSWTLKEEIVDVN